MSKKKNMHLMFDKSERNVKVWIEKYHACH